jgi:hypothetical protein
VTQLGAIDRLLTLDCELLERQAVDPLDPDAELELVVVGESRCELQQVTAGEAHEGRVLTAGLRVFLPADVELTGWDAIRVAGVVYELDGDPWQARHPRLEQVHHVEAGVRRVH